MAKLYYPVIFHPEDVGYSASVPDLEGCFTQGDSLEEALEMVQDAIGLYLDGEAEYPQPSQPEAIQTENHDFMMVVAFDRLAYQKKHNKRAVKKTLSIPAWLNEEAEAAHLNFSRILQEALKTKLNLN